MSYRGTAFDGGSLSLSHTYTYRDRNKKRTLPDMALTLVLPGGMGAGTDPEARMLATAAAMVCGPEDDVPVRSKLRQPPPTMPPPRYAGPRAPPGAPGRAPKGRAEDGPDSAGEGRGAGAAAVSSPAAFNRSSSASLYPQAQRKRERERERETGPSQRQTQAPTYGARVRVSTNVQARERAGQWASVCVHVWPM
jgi:hypothetical protein